MCWSRSTPSSSALNHIGTVDATGEGLVFHLLAHAGDFDSAIDLLGLTRAQR